MQELDHFMIVCRCPDGTLSVMDLQTTLDAVVDMMPRAEGIWRVVHIEGDRAWNESEKAAMLWLERNPWVDPDKDVIPPFVRENAKAALDNIRADVKANPDSYPGPVVQTAPQTPRPPAIVVQTDFSGHMNLPGKTCPKCDGEGGWPIDEDRPSRSSYCQRHGETYYSNWEDCDECGGSGEVDEEDAGEEGATA